MTNRQKDIAMVLAFVFFIMTLLSYEDPLADAQIVEQPTYVWDTTYPERGE